VNKRTATKVDSPYTVWAKHAKMKNWVPLMTGVSMEFAVREVVIRQDRVRRSGVQCIFKATPQGERPDGR